jgi:serine protease Do
MEVPVTIVELQDDKTQGGKQKPKKAPPGETNALGLHVSDLTPAQKRELKTDAGVVVESAEGRAATAGILPGDLILQMDNVEIKSASQFNTLVGKLDPKKTVAVLVRRTVGDQDATQYLVIKPREK